MDEYLRTRQATIGTTPASWTYDSNNQLSQVAATGVQRYDYLFNANDGNLTWRKNYLKDKTETFDYDTEQLDRLTKVTGPVTLSLGYTTNKNGNIQTKGDAGTYVYDATQPYAVDQVTGGQNISATPQDISYYSFEKVKLITEGTKTAEFVYNAEQQRIRMILKTSGTATKTRYYFGGSCEREVVGSTTTQYIWIGGDAYTAVAVAKKAGTGAWTVYNIFRDHLGTITHLKNGSNPADEYSFDAWGRRRDKDDWTMTLTSEPALFSDRGFTAHEYLEDFKLYNMNGRLYDPVVGRFLNADPVIQDPGHTQSYNRYSYCLNNPLKYADPSGNIYEKSFKNFMDDMYGTGNYWHRGEAPGTWGSAGFGRGGFNQNGGDAWRYGATSLSSNGGGGYWKANQTTKTIKASVEVEGTWVRKPSIEKSMTTWTWYDGDVLFSAKLGLYLIETSLAVNEAKATLNFMDAFRNSPRTKLQNAFPGHFKGISKNVNISLKALKVTKAVGQGLSRPFFLAGVAFSTADVVMNPSLNNIAWNITDIGVGAGALLFAASPVGWIVGSGAAIYFTGRLAYDVYNIYNEGE